MSQIVQLLGLADNLTPTTQTTTTSMRLQFFTVCKKLEIIQEVEAVTNCAGGRKY
jgi:hypothetical protein